LSDDKKNVDFRKHHIQQQGIVHIQKKNKHYRKWRERKLQLYPAISLITGDFT